jgi:Fic-DOC domain mobile mystery protein B
MSFEFNQHLATGATPLDPDEAAGLKLNHITQLSELNEFENQNIAKAIVWINRQREKNILTSKFVIDLHQRMFGTVWKWAGVFRTSDKNIGVPWYEIAGSLKVLLDDVQYWIDNSSYSLDEVASRLHHRLVSIHPFSNRNGRHARLYCDAFMMSQKSVPFTWGQKSVDVSVVRQMYLEALRAADNRDYSLLLEFVRR